MKSEPVHNTTSKCRQRQGIRIDPAEPHARRRGSRGAVFDSACARARPGGKDLAQREAEDRGSWHRRHGRQQSLRLRWQAKRPPIDAYRGQKQAPKTLLLAGMDGPLVTLVTRRGPEIRLTVGKNMYSETTSRALVKQKDN